jgi:hypothetical protein
VVHSYVIERSSTLTHMGTASDVSSHSSGAFPSGGFKPSCLAGLNSPAFFFWLRQSGKSLGALRYMQNPPGEPRLLRPRRRPPR